MKETKMQKGITLIALIITIIVLLILAGVAIASVSDSGIISHSKNAVREHQIGSEKEKITLSIDGWKIEKEVNKETTFKSFMEKCLENEATVEGPDVGPLTVTFRDTMNQYIVTDDGTITFAEKSIIIKDENGNIISENTITVEVGKTKTLTVEKTGGLEGEITYKSSDDAIATIDENGKVTGIAEGKATITISCGKYKDKCEVIIIAKSEDGSPENPSAVAALPDDNNPLTIGSIEELVDFSLAINKADPEGIYSGKTITLETSLSFTNSDSYMTDNPETTIYTKNGIEIDANGDGIIQPIMKELTEGVGFATIGYMDDEGYQVFTGTFDGKGNTIYDVYINRTEEMIIGFFGVVTGGTTIKNITLTGNITSNNGDGIVGGVVGMGIEITGNEQTLISNCHIKNMIINGTNSNVAGIIGIYTTASEDVTFDEQKTTLIIDNCTTDKDSLIVGYDTAGVICALNTYKTQIKNCTNNAKLRFKWRAAGILVTCTEFSCEQKGKTIIEDCINNGMFLEDDEELDCVAGICYYSSFVADLEIKNCVNNSEIIDYNDIECAGIAVVETHSDTYNFNALKLENCINNGNINSTNGGCAGIVTVEHWNQEEYYKDLDVMVINCSNKGDITGSYASGIMLARDNSVVNNSYNTGTINGSTEEATGQIVLGEGATYNNCYSITDTSKTAIGLRDELNAGVSADTTHTWSKWKIIEGINNGYPIFDWEQ